MLFDLPWIEILGELWKYGQKALLGTANEAMDETLDCESTLEIHNSKGPKATFSEQKKVHYLQDYIIAYWD